MNTLLKWLEWDDAGKTCCILMWQLPKNLTSDQYGIVLDVMFENNP